MNWQLPLMLAQSDPTGKTVLERLEGTTQQGTVVPPHALERADNFSSNPFATEYWFPEQASSFAGEVDFLYMAIFWISLVFFVAIIGVMIYFCIKYRRKDGLIDPQPSPSHNTAIEILWSVLPSILLVWMFYVGAESYFTMRIPKENAEEIQVVAQKYNWLFTYPDGDSSSELHLVLDQPVKLVMQSPDVLHSMYIPSFRQKMDIVPGRYTYAYIEPNKVGTYRLSCNEYCGTGHSKMRTAAIVHATVEERKNSTKWIEKEHQDWENGQRIYQIQCSGCHRVDSQAATGPALNSIWGEMENIQGGDQVKVDDNYVLESIWDPNKKIVAGYTPKMNSFKGILSQKQVSYVIAYLKKLKEETGSAN